MPYVPRVTTWLRDSIYTVKGAYDSYWASMLNSLPVGSPQGYPIIATPDITGNATTEFANEFTELDQAGPYRLWGVTALQVTSIRAGVLSEEITCPYLQLGCAVAAPSGLGEVCLLGIPYATLRPPTQVIVGACPTDTPPPDPDCCVVADLLLYNVPKCYVLTVRPEQPAAYEWSSTVEWVCGVALDTSFSGGGYTAAQGWVLLTSGPDGTSLGGPRGGSNFPGGVIANRIAPMRGVWRD